MHRILASRRERQLMLLGDAPRGAPSLWPPESAEAGDVADLQFSSKDFFTRGAGSTKGGATFLSEKWISAEGPSGDSSQAERRGKGRLFGPPVSGLQVPTGLHGNNSQNREKESERSKSVLPLEAGSAVVARAPQGAEIVWETGRNENGPSSELVQGKDVIGRNVDENLLEVGRQEPLVEAETGRQEALIEQEESLEEQAERALAQLKRDSEGEILRDPSSSVVEPSGPGSPSLCGSPALSPLPSSTSDFFHSHPLPRPDFERIRAALDAADALFKTPSPSGSAALAAAAALRQTSMSPNSELSSPRWSDLPVVSLPPRVRRLIAAANQLMHTPRGSGALDGASSPRARSGDSLEDDPSLRSDEDTEPVDISGGVLTGPTRSLRNLRLTSPNEERQGGPSLRPLYSNSTGAGNGEPFSTGNIDPFPDQGSSPLSPLPADSPISSALFGSNPVIHSDAEDSPHRLPDPNTGPFSSARGFPPGPDELRVGFFQTVETVDQGVFASFDSVTGGPFQPGMILCGQDCSPRNASPTGTPTMFINTEAPQTKRLVIPDIQSKSLEIPYVPRVVKLSLKRAAASAAAPKPLKPPHAPGSSFKLPIQSPFRRTPGKNYWDFKHVGGGALRPIATAKVPPGTYQPGEGQQNPSPPSSGTGGSPDSAAFPPASPPEDDWFDLDLFQEQRALPRIRTRRRTSGSDQAVTRSFGNLYEVRNAVRAAPSATISRGIGRYGSPRTALQRRITTRSLADWSDFLEARENALRLAHGALKRPPAGARAPGAPEKNLENAPSAQAARAPFQEAVHETESGKWMETGILGGGDMASPQEGHVSKPVQAGGPNFLATLEGNGGREAGFEGLGAAAATGTISAQESPVNGIGGTERKRKGSAWACCFGKNLATTSLELKPHEESKADGTI
ncbi:hypothetical protein KFL_001350230 [Klebsormidium nitens]|uniref:Uncharacterized protein n=1 Tax=Klebsormidium nitens TaxID=105231 RepID=A0A1Y1I0X9_KLENI|nr:hypothetical protein KFL_001350230 [Klebsormidium nitens]|eukprot:GAQ83099.1 hypothetical protein KFL_001350230 [Klebsormidium nitens]